MRLRSVKTAVLALMTAATILSPCSAGSVISPVTIVSAAESVSLNKEKLSLYIGHTYKLKLKNSKAKVKWSSSDKKIATVDKKGLVTAKDKGSCVIRAKVKQNGKYKTYKCTVKVKRKALQKAWFNENEISLAIGAAGGQAILAKPHYYHNEDFKWSSANEYIASVDDKGVVTGIEKGRVMITAIRGDIMASYYVNVTDEKVAQITLSGTTSMKQGDSALLTSYIVPFFYKNTDLSWSSSNTDIVSVDKEGFITAEAPGTAVITASRDGASGSLVVNVGGGAPGSSVRTISLENGEQTLVTIDDPRMVKMYFSVDDVSDDEITAEWTGDSAGILPYVSAEGKSSLTLLVKGNADGKGVITVYDDAGQRTIIKVDSVGRPVISCSSGMISSENGTFFLNAFDYQAVRVQGTDKYTIQLFVSGSSMATDYKSVVKSVTLSYKLYGADNTEKAGTIKLPAYGASSATLDGLIGSGNYVLVFTGAKFTTESIEQTKSKGQTGSSEQTENNGE